MLDADPAPALAAADRLFLDFQAAVAGRYSLERELGRSGMGVVYLAREVREIDLALDQWASAHGIRLDFIRPGLPVRTASSRVSTENCVTSA